MNSFVQEGRRESWKKEEQESKGKRPAKLIDANCTQKCNQANYIFHEMILLLLEGRFFRKTTDDSSCRVIGAFYPIYQFLFCGNIVWVVQQTRFNKSWKWVINSQAFQVKYLIDVFISLEKHASGQQNVQKNVKIKLYTTSNATLSSIIETLHYLLYHLLPVQGSRADGCSQVMTRQCPCK